MDLKWYYNPRRIYVDLFKPKLYSKWWVAKSRCYIISSPFRYETLLPTQIERLFIRWSVPEAIMEWRSLSQVERKAFPLEASDSIPFCPSPNTHQGPHTHTFREATFATKRSWILHSEWWRSATAAGQRLSLRLRSVWSWAKSGLVSRWTRLMPSPYTMCTWQIFNRRQRASIDATANSPFVSLRRSYFICSSGGALRWLRHFGHGNLFLLGAVQISDVFTEALHRSSPHLLQIWFSPGRWTAPALHRFLSVRTYSSGECLTVSSLRVTPTADIFGRQDFRRPFCIPLPAILPWSWLSGGFEYERCRVVKIMW